MQFFKNLPPVKRASVVISSIVVFVAAVVAMFMMSGADHSILFSNVPSDQLPLIVDRLQKKNIPFRLEQDGKVVTVLTGLLYATQMNIMAEIGDTKLGSTGLELFDKQDFGVTSYAQRI